MRGLVGRIDALEAARSDLESRVEALQSDNVSLNRKVDCLTRDNAILREEIAGLKYGASTADKSRKRSKSEHCVLMTLGNDATVHIASFVGAKDIACLGRTCGHFGRSYVWSDGQITSLVEDLAGQVANGSATDYEKSVLVAGKKIKMLRELELMRSPLYFKQMIGDGNVIKYSQPLQEMSTISLSCDDYATAIGNHVMRTGKHYVTFCVCGESDDESDPGLLDFGVVRPIKDWDKKGLESFYPTCHDPDQRKHRKPLLAERTEEWGNDLHCCSYHSYDGKCYHSSWSDEHEWGGEDDYEWGGDEWGGMEPLAQTGQPLRDMDDCKVGLLLDLNCGRLSVFKDGRLLGVMKEGLTGAYCWYVCGSGITCTVKIERGMPPVTKMIEYSAVKRTRPQIYSV